MVLKNQRIVAERNHGIILKENVIEVKGVDHYKSSGEEGIKETGKGANIGMTTSVAMLSFLNGYAAVALFRIFQLIDYLMFYQVRYPRNLLIFIRVLSQPSVLSEIPNPFEPLNDSHCKAMPEKFEENDMKC